MQKRIRQFHRWTSIVFTATVLATFGAFALEEPVEWVSYTPLLPLFLLMVTGLYLFALPYTRRRVSGGSRADR